MLFDFHSFNEFWAPKYPVLILAGQYDIFSQIIIDKQREHCRGIIDLADVEVDEEELKALGVAADDVTEKANSLDFNEFYSLVRMPSMVGKWFCVVDYAMLDAAQLKKLVQYMENPSKYGVLIIVSKQYKDYQRLCRDRTIRTSPQIGYISLNYPTKSVLKQIVTTLFASKGLVLDTGARDLFISRLSTSYDDYQSIAENFYMYQGKLITYSDMLEGLQGVENFILDDLMLELTKVVTKDKKTSRKIYKMMRSLLGDYKASELLRKINLKARDICEMRYYINKGYIPAGFAFDIKEAQERMFDKSRLRSLTPVTFRKLVGIATKSTLQDWLYIVQLTSQVSQDETLNMYKLHTLIHRDLFDRVQLLQAVEGGMG